MMLMTLVVMVRAFAIGRAAFRYVEKLALHDSAFRMLERMRVLVFQKLEPIAPAGLKNFKKGDLVARLTDDVDELQNKQLRVLPGLLQSLIATLLVFAMILVYLPTLAFAELFIMIASFALSFGLNFFLGTKAQSQVANSRAELYSTLIDVAERSDVLIAFGWREQSEKVLIEQSGALVRIEKATAKISGVAATLLVVGLALTQLIAVSLGSEAVVSGSVNRVLLAGFVLLPTVVFEFYQLALPAVAAYRRYLGSKKRVDDVLTLKPQKFDGDQNLSSFEALRVTGAVVDLEPGLSVDLPDFVLHKGDTLALVGKSGSGKSTLANVLVGFTPIAGGQILLNGKGLGTYSHESLRQTIGLVEQGSNLLIGSVAANLRIARPNASDQELIAVLQKVGLWHVLQGRDGLDTEVGENGKNLSGGEASRIALARVLLARRELVILDEPTAALDRELAHSLIRDLVHISKAEGKTLILITHDPDLIGHCDATISF